MASVGGVAKLAANITGAFLNAYGTYSAFQQQEYASKYNQQLIEANEKIRQASFEMDKERTQRAQERFYSTQKAVMAEQGFTFSGSNIDIALDTLEEMKLDLFAIEFNQQASQASAESAIAQERQKLNAAKANKVTGTLAAFLGALG